MKKDRDCGMQMPYMVPFTPYMPMGGYNPNYNNYNYSNDYNTITNQINSLEKRVANLENIINNTKYNNSTYQMM